MSIDDGKVLRIVLRNSGYNDKFVRQHDYVALEYGAAMERRPAAFTNCGWAMRSG